MPDHTQINEILLKFYLDTINQFNTACDRYGTFPKLADSICWVVWTCLTTLGCIENQKKKREKVLAKILVPLLKSWGVSACNSQNNLNSWDIRYSRWYFPYFEYKMYLEYKSGILLWALKVHLLEKLK